jgi:hypothetical protein
MGQMAANNGLRLLGGPQAVGAVALNVIENMESGLAAVPAEGRSLHGALHVFEARFLDSFFPML